MGRFKSPGQAQRFLSIHDQSAAMFRPNRHRLFANPHRACRNDAFARWSEYTDQLVA
jgi:putative transposase